MDIIQRPADRLHIPGFQFHFHCQVMSKNVRPRQNTEARYCVVVISSLRLPSSIKCVHWFKSCLDPFFQPFFTASDTAKGCLYALYFTGFKYTL